MKALATGKGIGAPAFWELPNSEDGGGPAGVVEAAASEFGGGAAGVVDGLENPCLLSLWGFGDLVLGVDGGLVESGTWNMASTWNDHVPAGGTLCLYDLD